jgi:hypothetical protein
MVISTREGGSAMKPRPRFTPEPSSMTGGGPGQTHDPYVPPRLHKHGWSHLPDRVHLGRGFRLKGRIRGAHVRHGD